jgi:hypothetical protein
VRAWFGNIFRINAANNFRTNFNIHAANNSPAFVGVCHLHIWNNRQAKGRND